ncbi:MAG TPA: CAP domain-containing protein [Thermoanaerobaculia bacterium]
MSSARKILTVLTLAAGWVLIAASSASATTCPNTEVQVSGMSQGQMESSITCLINEERSSFGLHAVQPNGNLRDAALSHSNEMVDQRYFEHTSPQGVTFIDRIEATGYMRGARSWVVGENLVWGTGPLSTPQSLVTAWMNSPPHRENLLKPRFSEIGVAAVDGTPEGDLGEAGVTVSSEYGSRAGASKKKSRGKARKARFRKRHRYKHSK